MTERTKDFLTDGAGAVLLFACLYLAMSL